MRIKLTETQIRHLQSVITEDELTDKISKIGDYLDYMKKMSGESPVGDSDSESSSYSSPTIKSGLDVEALKFPNKIDILPVLNTRVNSPFGPRNVGGGASRNHQGVDLFATSGTDVISVADGVVIVAKDTTPDGCGGFVKIKHEEYVTKYCHLKEWTVRKGDTVKKGQIIGRSGGSKSDPFRGNSMGAHLHYEIWKNGRPVNPAYIHPSI